MTDKTKIDETIKKAGIDPESEEICFLPIARHAINYEGFAEIENRADFYEAAQCYIRTVALHYAEQGVRFISLDGVVICPTAKIGKGTVIYPNVQIKDGVTVGENCELTSGTVLSGTTVGNGCHINATQIYDSVLDDNVIIGPFSHVRPGTHLMSGVKVGDFVEFKNSEVGCDTKVAHLTYVGDADVGERVNFGCGTVVSNYDGKSKYRTKIGNDSFIGCNTNLIAPVTVEDHAYTAAGSTITDTVPEGALGIARARQVNLSGWVDKKFGKN